MMVQKKVVNQKSRIYTPIISVSSVIIIPLLLYTIQDDFRQFIRTKVFKLPYEYRTEVKLTSPFNWTVARKNINNSGTSSEIFHFPIDYSWKPVPLTSPAHSQPVIDNGFIYICTHYGNRLYKIDARSGEVVWQFDGKYGDQATYISIFQNEELITVDKEYVFVHTRKGLDAYKPIESKIPIWEYKAIELNPEYPTIRHPMSTPQVVDSVIIFTNDFHIYRLLKSNGTLLNCSELDGDIINAPAIDIEDNRIYVLLQFYSDKDNFQWEFSSMAAKIMHTLIETLVLNNYIVEPKKHIDFDHMELWALDLKTLKPVWKKRIDGKWNINSCPVFSQAQGLVLLGMDDALNAFHSKTGDLKWMSPIGGNISTPAIKDYNTIICIGEKSSEVVSLIKSNGRIQWKKKIPELVTGLSPSLSNNNAFVTAKTAIYALDLNTGEITWKSPTFGDLQTSPSIAYGQLLFIGYDKKGEGPFLFSFSDDK